MHINEDIKLNETKPLREDLPQSNKGDITETTDKDTEDKEDHRLFNDKYLNTKLLNLLK